MSWRIQKYNRLRLLPLVMLALFAAVLTIGTALSYRSASGYEGARAFLDGIPDERTVRDGEVLYTAIDTYVRFGPKATAITDGSTGFATERFVGSRG